MDKRIYRIVKKPLTNWKPFREDPLSKEEPWLDIFTPPEIPRNPAPGDFLVITEDAQVKASLDEEELATGFNYFDDVSFRNMPSLEELLRTGTVVEVTEDAKYHEEMLRMRRIYLNQEIQSERGQKQALEAWIAENKEKQQIGGVEFTFHTDDTIAAFLDLCQINAMLECHRNAKFSLENELQAFTRQYAA